MYACVCVLDMYIGCTCVCVHTEKSFNVEEMSER